MNDVAAKQEPICLTWISGESLRDFNDRALLELLRVNGGKRSEAAKTLGISVRTVRIWTIRLKKAGHDVPIAFVRGQWKSHNGPNQDHADHSLT